MVGFTESLTVEIKGDSTGLRNELESVKDQLSRFSAEFANIGSGEQGLRRLGTSFSSLFSPLQNLSNLTAQFGRQIAALGSVAIDLNVTPAITSLLQLSAMTDYVTSRLQHISGATAVTNLLSGAGQFNGVGGVPALPGGGGGFARFAEGGYVSGIAGVDRVPALLSPGEFVLQSTAVDKLGLAFLDSLNRNKTEYTSSRTSSKSSQQLPVHEKTSPRGDIHIHVHETVELSEVVRELQVKGHRLRTRRG